MKMLKMAITTPNSCYFERYGNLFPNPNEFGIFNGLNDVISALNIPNYNMKSLNQLYFQRSKFKKLSTFVYDILDYFGVGNLQGGTIKLFAGNKKLVIDNDTDIVVNIGSKYYTIDSEGYNQIVDMIKTKNLYNWSKLVDTYKKDYDMLSPFKMSVDDRSNDNLESQDVSDNNGQSVNTSTGDYQGFNSSEYNPVDKSVDSAVDNNHRTSAYNRSNAHTRVTERSGNIGNRSSQELIKEERGLWVWNLYNQIFSDIDKILTKGIY